MFKRMQSMQMQAVHCFQTTGPDQQTYRAIIAIHNTQLGPALGGCRCLPYSHEQLAFDDAMRLAQGMSYKAALANLNQGGGKSVILLPSHINSADIDRKFVFEWFGQCVDQLNGQYITAMDVGTQVSDMDIIAAQTRHVASASDIGDPAESTARGVMVGIKTSLEFKFGNSFIAGRQFAVQGLGHVGWRIAQQLMQQGGEVVVADMNADIGRQAQALGMQLVSVDDILYQQCDVLVPCALGGIIDEDNVSLLQCEIIAGSANNQLATDETAKQLTSRNILYAPDYVINAGGLIFASVHYNYDGASDLMNTINQKIDGIRHTLLELFQQASSSNQDINKVANELAEKRLAEGVSNCINESDAKRNDKGAEKGDVYDAA